MEGFSNVKNQRKFKGKTSKIEKVSLTDTSVYEGSDTINLDIWTFGVTYSQIQYK